MQNLGTIIEQAKGGEKPDYDELLYAVCALDALLTFDAMALSKLATGEQENRKKRLTYSSMFQYEESFNRVKRALSKSPKEWVGWNNDPENPDYQNRRRVSKKICEKFTPK